jgi:hypothetical protein
MHTAALSLTARPHSLHAISVMVLSPTLLQSGRPYKENQRIGPNSDQGAGTVDVDV